MTGAIANDPAVSPHWLKVVGARLSRLPISYAGTAVLLLCAGLARPNLLQPFLLLLIMRQAAPMGIAVIGQSLCIRLLSLDLSFGGVAIAVSYILTSGYLPFSEPVLIVLCLLLGVAVGATNAFFITQLRASSVIVTLAMVLILGGVVTAFSQFRAPGESPGDLTLYRAGAHRHVAGHGAGLDCRAHSDGDLSSVLGVRALRRCDWR